MVYNSTTNSENDMNKTVWAVQREYPYEGNESLFNVRLFDTYEKAAAYRDADQAESRGRYEVDLEELTIE